MTGSVADSKKPGRPTSITTEVNIVRVSQFYSETPQTSSRRASHQLQISQTSIRRMINSLGLKHYIPRLMQELNEDDFDRSVQFCETMLHAAAADSNLLHRIIWSDEATFHLNVSVNRHNTVYYSQENPDVTVEKAVASVRVTV